MYDKANVFMLFEFLLIPFWTDVSYYCKKHRNIYKLFNVYFHGLLCIPSNLMCRITKWVSVRNKSNLLNSMYYDTSYLKSY